MEPNPFKPDLDPKTRFIVLYRDAEMKVSRISKLIKIPETTLYNWKRKFDEDEDLYQHKSKNSAPKVTAQKQKAIVREAKNSTRTVSSRKLGAKHGVSHTTICTILGKRGLNYGNQEQTHTLTEDEQQDRVRYSEDMLKKRKNKIKRTFYSDEMGVKLSEVNKCRKDWGPSTRKKVKIERKDDVKLNCYAAISWEVVTDLEIYEENLNNEMYQSILEKYADDMADMFHGRDFYYQQDNHPTHRNVEVLNDWNQIELIDFPTYSPDLNPIENLWSTLKYRVACDAPRSKKGLESSLLKNWEELRRPENLRPYIETLYGRYSECIQQNGGRLPY